MKYTYQIQFGSSDYVDLYPNSDVEMTGEWETGTMIWREKISEIKITKAKNSAVYDLLESWFEDKDYFETMIKIKILKNTVQDSVHWFGVKWGKVDKELKTYNVEPMVYDLWSQYMESNLESDSSILNMLRSIAIYDDDTNFSYLQTVSSQRLWYLFSRTVADVTDLTITDVVSTFMNNDAYENASTVSDIYGMKRDYVTDSVSFMYYAQMRLDKTKSIKYYLDLFTLFSVYPFFDSHDKLRLEHISFFNERLEDNAVDFSAYINSDDDVFEYIDTDLVTNEKITLSDSPDQDFSEIDIVYSDIRNRPDVQNIEVSSQFIGDLNQFGTTTITSAPLLIGAYENYVYKFDNVDFVSFTSFMHSYSFGWSAIGQRCESKDMKVSNGKAYAYSINHTLFTSPAGVLQYFFEDRSSGLLISNVVTWGTSGSTSGSLTATANSDDAILVIRSESGATGQVQGYINITVASDSVYPAITYPNLDDTNKTNGTMSIGNIIDRWGQDDRAARSGTINGDAYNFNSTKYSLKRSKPIKFHYTGVINPLYGFNDGTRIGKINKWTRSLDTDFYEIDVIYQEDE